MLRKFKSLSGKGKFGVIAVVFTVLGLIGSANQPAKMHLQKVDPPSSTSSPEVLGTQTTKPQPAKPKVAAPVATTSTLTETQPIPFASTTVNTASLPKGTSKITTVGVNGVSTLTYEVTTTDGKQTAKTLLSTVTTTPPVTQITSIGTYVAPAYVPSTPTPSSSCDPNYSGACVPIASDVDCAGGSGNGPAYVQGPVRVIGSDIYGLDRDGNGIGCE